MTTASISDKPEDGKKELSLEELKALRLCKCGNWKHGRWPQCNQCFLLFGGEGEQEFYDLLKEVKAGKVEYEQLFPLIDAEIPSRKSVMLGILIANHVRVSVEDFIFFRKNKERLGLKKQHYAVQKGRNQVLHTLAKAVPVYSGMNTSPR